MRFVLLFLLFFYAVDLAEAYQFASGSYSGTGSGFTVDISDTTTPSIADFQPRACIVKRGDGTGADGVWRIEGMTANESFPFDGSATITTGITVLTSNGFTIGNHANVNASGVTYYYVCFAEDANNDFAYGSYAGNNTNNRSITISPAFQPEVVLSDQDVGGGAWRGASSHTTTSSNFALSADDTDEIDLLEATGFRVDLGVNVTGNTYFYIAFKTGLSTVATGNYTGDTNDDRAITVGFQPEFFLVKTNTANFAGAIKFKDQTTDTSCTTNSDCTTNRVQTFSSTGVVVGTNGTANENTATMRWFAIREAATTASFGPMRRRAQ